MAICTFFGHRDTPQQVNPILRAVLTDLIENKNVNMFYVGNHGNFDYMVRSNLKSLKLDYPNMNYAVVLAYLPSPKNKLYYEDYSDTIYPDGLENAPMRYAVIKRNIWMIDKSDYVVTYITHP